MNPFLRAGLGWNAQRRGAPPPPPGEYVPPAGNALVLNFTGAYSTPPANQLTLNLQN